MTDSAATRPPLRERKKLRTRQALIDTALDLFTRQGFGGVTLDELCDRVEVSKRTFFRNFAGKEDVALAPTRDFWVAFLAELDTVEPDGRPVLDLVLAALRAALDRMESDDWPRRALLSNRLAQQAPSVDAHGREFCERTTLSALEILHRRFDLGATPGDMRPRLALDMAVAAFHCALSEWTAQADGAGEVRAPGAPDRRELADRISAAFAALPGSITLTAAPAPTNGRPGIE